MTGASHPLALAVGAVVAVVVSAVGVALVRGYAERNAIVDVPNARSSHVRPTPRGGGLAIVFVVLVGALIWALWSGEAPRWVLAGYMPAAALIAVVSGLDDVGSVSPPLRFGAHALAALLLILQTGPFPTFRAPVVGSQDLGWAALPITLLWVVGLTNAYNFMDGIDGIAGAQAVVAGLGWVALGLQAGRPTVAVLGGLAAAASLGFLVFNWPPARIFMGDIGSAFLGFTFAATTVAAAQSDGGLAFAGALLVAPFIFDTVFTVLRRLRHGENMFAPHRTHLYQRMLAAGRYRHRDVTILYAGLATVTAGLALGWMRFGEAVGPLVLGLLLVGAFALWGVVVRLERRRCSVRSVRRVGQ